MVSPLTTRALVGYTSRPKGHQVFGKHCFIGRGTILTVRLGSLSSGECVGRADSFVEMLGKVLSSSS